MNWYFKALKMYAVFRGRARRKEYWYFTLFNMILMVVFAAIDGFTGTFSIEAGMGVLGGIYALVTLLPALAVSVRRLHDAGHSGWWLFIGLIPLIGFIVLIVFMVQDSKPGNNQYGANPKEATV
ncbi:MAG: DUF805 domain-containing protein [Magnetococcales bacterium]|nr:DUF805 domain-containing protein [Magnetococcales bacterium]